MHGAEVSQLTGRLPIIVRLLSSSYIYVYAYTCIYVYAHLSLSLPPPSLSVSLYLSLSLYIYMHAYVVCIYTRINIHMYLYMHMHTCTCLDIYHTCMRIYLAVFLCAARKSQSIPYRSRRFPSCRRIIRPILEEGVFVDEPWSKLLIRGLCRSYLGAALTSY